jgi:hypothetical protein
MRIKIKTLEGKKITAQIEPNNAIATKKQVEL